VFDVFGLPFVQRGLWEVLLLAIPAGLLGTWIVLRGLAFFTHATGTAAFPGLVVADGLGFAAPLGALGAAAVFAVAVVALGGGRRRTGGDTLTALALVGALACGVLLASDVFGSGARVDTLLFGSLLVVGGRDLVLAGAAGVLAAAASAMLGERWLARGFDPDAARFLGLRSRWPDLALLGLVAFAVIASLAAVGALLVTALFVVPAATARLVVARVRPWQWLSVALAALEGAVGLWIAVEANAPPGPAIAVVSGAVFAVVALRRFAVPALAGAALLALAGCGAVVHSDGRPIVVATTTQLADVARNVAGPDAQVVGLLKPNTDPHEYEPRPDDVRATADASLVLESGRGLDGWMGDVVRQSGADARVLDLGAGMAYVHWWHDPAAVERVALRIGAALHEQARARAYVARVRALDRRIRACFARVPVAQRRLVTDHDAFGAFAARYGIRIVGTVIPAQTTVSQASARDLARLEKTIEREHVRAVFPEASVSARVADAVARQTGASTRYELYGDALGPRGSAGATYLGMEAANADAMVRGFTGGRLGCRIRV
jgi:ABC-type Zn uptake system ZnuABC Zn-binding protein ZnuA/ABC-type Mn2+/Zn2+ transport system permease subunit